MTKDEFIDILTNTGHLSDGQLQNLEKLVEAFPYCQSAHILIAKGYFERDNMLSPMMVRKGSLYTSDRKHLKAVVEKGLYDQKEKVPAPQAEETIEPTTVSEKEINKLTDAEAKADKSQVKEEKQVESASEERKKETEEIIQPEPVKSDIPDKKGVKETPASTEDEKSETFDDELRKTLEQLKVSREQASETGKAEKKTPKKEPKKSPASKKSDKKEDKKKPEAESEKPIARKQTRARKPTRAKKQDNSKSKANKAKSSKSPFRYSDRKLGYTMPNSRYGEALEEKGEETNEAPRTSYPDLILDYLDRQRKAKTQGSKRKTREIIGDFLKNEKNIGPIRAKNEQDSTDLSQGSTKQNPELITENLARINAKQGNKKKAIEIYEKLSLRYPEKKSYFAALIDELKQKD